MTVFRKNLENGHQKGVLVTVFYKNLENGHQQLRQVALATSVTSRVDVETGGFYS
ncbi:hypothetical protein GCM10007096_05020 [Pullulanibacillus pueri]|uniref:Uncharacterized protein n=1 Tax=Pullulanibacillus pueri TaxID=1437324 RepID=A0A8J3EKE6_9BACL|nr:hypothetical protein GCM10007096_05020 [Pullulanibacillus pueri]